MTALKSRAALLTRVSEKTWQGVVVRMAKERGWACYYVHDSRHSPAGWPDLFMMRPPRAIAAELKSQKGHVTVEQAMCLAVLEACGIEVYVWKPADEDAARDVLR